ncbi:MAG: hypothetical protein RR478_04385 [Bacilli bacterium]
MQKAIFGMETMNCTQGMGVGTHAYSYAMDFAGLDGGINYLMAPFTGKIVKTYEADANEVWLESLGPVLFADGTKDFMVMMCCHADDISNLFVGKIIEQGDKNWYREGNKGMSTGNHVHIECGKGRFDGIGWHKNEVGYWGINNSYPLNKCLFVPNDFNIISNGGVEWTRTENWVVEEKIFVGKPIERNDNVDQVEVFKNITELRARNKPYGDVIGYINGGIYNLLGREQNGEYEWLNIEKDVWIAYNPEWEAILSKKEETPTDYKELYNDELLLNKLLNEEISNLKQEQKDYKFITKILKNGIYAIELKENENLYIK